METVTVCVLNSEALASKLGKKGSETDMTLYNHKSGDRALTVACPIAYPEKLAPLFYSLYLGDYVILVVDRLDRWLGEMMVACDVMGKTDGLLVLENFMTGDQIRPLVKDTALEVWPMADGAISDPNVLREELMRRTPTERPGPTKVAVDRSFTVKGLGTVCLGLVDRGAVSRHQALVSLPGGKTTTVRSIQVHDNDVDDAGTGNRVGLALKGVEPGDVPRGSVLAPAGTLHVVDSLSLDLRISRFWSDTLRDGMVVHLASGMQFLAGRLSVEGEMGAGDSGRIGVRLDGRMVLEPRDPVLVSWLESTGPRIVGLGRPIDIS